MNRNRTNRRRKINRPRPLPAPRRAVPWRMLGSLALVLLVLTGMVAGARHVLNQPVIIEVAGTGQRVSVLEVEAVLQPIAGTGFLDIELAAVRAAAETLPWVDRARIQRAFPARLVVTITEQVAAARWGQSGLLNTRGELFVTDSRYALPELPALAGPAGSEWRVAQRYLEIHGLLTPLGLSVRSLQLSPRGAWDLTLASGIGIRLGRERAADRLARLAGVVAPLLQATGERVAYIDLRYSNGFVLGWQPGKAPLADHPEKRETI